MLPFLGKIKVRQNDDAMIQRTPDAGKEDESDQGLKSCAQSLIDAISNKDASAVAQAFKDLIDMCDSQPEEYSEQDKE